MTVTEFLTARLHEDEAAAIEAGEDPIGWVTFRHADGSMDHTAVGVQEEEGWIVDGRLVQDSTARPFYDPAQRLAHVAAVRWVIEYVATQQEHAKRFPDPPFSLVHEASASTGEAILRHLAAAYADHPDFDPAWVSREPATV